MSATQDLLRSPEYKTMLSMADADAKAGGDVRWATRVVYSAFAFGAKATRGWISQAYFRLGTPRECYDRLVAAGVLSEETNLLRIPTDPEWLDRSGASWFDALIGVALGGDPPKGMTP